MVVIGFTAPATLHELKWERNMLYVVAMLKYQRATLKEDGCTRGRGKIKRFSSTHCCKYVFRLSKWG
jgi:hypothetical protein